MRLDRCGAAAPIKANDGHRSIGAGGIPTTPDGDLKLGDARFNAMHRLVQGWRFNAPTLAVLFDSVARMQERKLQWEAEKGDIASTLFNDPQAKIKFHQLNNEIEAVESGAAAYADAIIVVLNNLLARLKSDLNATADNWAKATPLIQGCSVATIIKAASNNFRHHDEWAKTEPPNGKQLESIRVIASVLKVAIQPKGMHHPFRRNICPELVAVLSGGNFEQLNRNVFSFANSMVG